VNVLSISIEHSLHITQHLVVVNKGKKRVKRG
jgi:hypothetical protein